jgi:LETM1 and EF-hand domain-containing protein 1
VLLVLSRAFNFESKGEGVMASLVTTLSSLPENLVSGVKWEIDDGH